MMMRTIATAAALLAATGAYAAEKQWTDAPTSGLASPTVAPSERAGRSSGPDNSSPFSGIPSGAAASGGQTSSSATAAPDVGTPSVSR